MFTEGNPQAPIPSVEHLTGHEGVEDCCAHQGHAEVESKEPPVLHVLVKLSREEEGRWDIGKEANCEAPCSPHSLCAHGYSLYIQPPSLSAVRTLHLCSVFFYLITGSHVIT